MPWPEWASFPYVARKIRRIPWHSYDAWADDAERPGTCLMHTASSTWIALRIAETLVQLTVSCFLSTQIAFLQSTSTKPRGTTQSTEAGFVEFSPARGVCHGCRSSKLMIGA